MWRAMQWCGGVVVTRCRCRHGCGSVVEASNDQGRARRRAANRSQHCTRACVWGGIVGAHSRAVLSASRDDEGRQARLKQRRFACRRHVVGGNLHEENDCCEGARATAKERGREARRGAGAERRRWVEHLGSMFEDQGSGAGVIASELEIGVKGQGRTGVSRSLPINSSRNSASGNTVFNQPLLECWNTMLSTPVESARFCD